MRMALGAPRALIVRLVAREMSLVVLAGLAAGVATAYACGRYVQSQLFEVRANDPLVFAARGGDAAWSRRHGHADPRAACVANERRAGAAI